jgi:hypothetical protein
VVSQKEVGDDGAHQSELPDHGRAAAGSLPARPWLGRGENGAGREGDGWRRLRAVVGKQERGTREFHGAGTEGGRRTAGLGAPWEDCAAGEDGWGRQLHVRGDREMASRR